MADTAATPSVHVPSTLEQRKYDEATSAGAAPAEATELSRATPAPGSTWHEPQGEAPDMDAANARADTAVAARVVEPTTPVAVRTPRTSTRSEKTARKAATSTTTTKAGTKKATSKKR